MKKILCLLLVVVMSFMLFSCGDDTIGAELDDLKEIYNPVVREDMELDFYIIVEDGTTENAISTVQRMINQYLSDNFKTTLDMHYVTADQYENEVMTAVQATGDDKADIVLVVGKDMFDNLYENHHLANITDFYSTTKYGRLNTQITSTILDGVVVTEQRTTHENVPYDVFYKYVVPNNHIVGSYEYILIDKDSARDVCYSDDKLKLMTTYDLTAELRASLEENGFNPDDCVKQVTGKYEDKVMYEAEGYYVNISRYPTVDAAEAFMSSFGIVRHEKDLRHENTEDIDPNTDPEDIVKEDTSYLDYYDRCMEVIYAINSDVYLRNLLQYGIKGTNYTENADGTVTSFTDGDGVYKMNLIYTGDIFKAYFCEELGWNSEVAANGENQNKQSQLFEEPQEPEADSPAN